MLVLLMSLFQLVKVAVALHKGGDCKWWISKRRAEA